MAYSLNRDDLASLDANHILEFDGSYVLLNKTLYIDAILLVIMFYAIYRITDEGGNLMKHIDTILKLAEIFEAEVEKQASKWEKMPPGWKAKSRKSFFKNLADESVGECMKRMEDHIDDPGAFCASLKDRVKKTTHWREGNPENLKKKKKKKKDS